MPREPIAASDTERAYMAELIVELGKLEVRACEVLGKKRGRNVFGTTLAAAIALDMMETAGDVRENFNQTMELGWNMAMLTQEPPGAKT